MKEPSHGRDSIEPAPKDMPGPEGERPRPFVIRDPMFGDIALTLAERDVLDSDIFQRQRGVKQLGTSLLLYPSAVQTRFVHAVGNLHIAGEMIAAALDSDPVLAHAFLERARDWLAGVATVDDQPAAVKAGDPTDVRRRIEQIVRIAGMCHDLGHFPMGHVLEDALSDRQIVEVLVKDEETEAWSEWVTLRGAAVHEFATIQLLEHNGGGRFTKTALPRAVPFRHDNEWLRQGVLAVIQATHVAPEAPPPHPIARALAELISSDIDSDRAEYLRRDSVVTGAGYGQYDIERLIDSYTIARTVDGGFVFRPSSRALAAVQTFLLERVKAYGHLYYHNLGYLMDALLGVVLRALYRPTDVERLRLELNDANLEKDMRLLRAQLPLERLHYDNFDDPSGYIDDATLWQFLREVLGWLEGLTLSDAQMELRRVRVYLRALLRRRHVWVSLWKSPEEFQRMSNLTFDAFCIVVRRRYGSTEQPTIAKAIAVLLAQRTKIEIPAERVSVLNFIAHEYREEGRLQQLARELERRLRARKPSWLEGALFVEVGERAKFKPLKSPATYEIIDAEGSPRRLRDLARASVDAIMAWWFDGYPQLRMYVVTELELDKPRRDELRGLACDELPAAVSDWYAGLPQQLDPEQVLAAKNGGGTSVPRQANPC